MSFGTLLRTHPALAALRDAERVLDRSARLSPVVGWPQRGVYGFAPRLQAVENEKEYSIGAELPGVEAEDLEVYVEDGVLVVKGVRKYPGWSSELPAEERSRYEVPFERRVRFNAEIDAAGVKARYRNGLLEVTVPKHLPPPPVIKSIPIEAA